MNTLLLYLGWGVIRSQWGRFLAAALSIAIGVALALSIHLINRSALDEFSGAMSAVNGEANLQVKARLGRLPDEAFAELMLDRDVAEASPIIEIDLMLHQNPLIAPGDEGVAKAAPLKLKVLGLDFLRAGTIQPSLLPRTGFAEAFRDNRIFLSVQTLYALEKKIGDTLLLQGKPLTIAGEFLPAQDRKLMAVMDIANLQYLMQSDGWLGYVSRVDIKLQSGVSTTQFKDQLQQRHPAWIGVEPSDSVQRMSNLSRAYRVNLNVLALVALVSGAFMVYATMSLAVRRQAKQQALLAILGAPQSLGRNIVLSQGLAVGLVGSILGLLLGVALAYAVLSLVGGDLGGGYFSGSRPQLSLDAWAMLAFVWVGVLVSLLGSIVPALQLRQLAPAQAIRTGLDLAVSDPSSRALMLSILLGLIATLALVFAPAWQGIPIAAYLAIGLLIVVGVALVPIGVNLVSHALARDEFFLAQWPSYWLASQKLERLPGNASAAVAGIVASLALASAMAIMVHSFRASVDQWLETVLPAEMYLRKSNSAQKLSLDALERILKIPGIAKVEAVRAVELSLSEKLAPIVLLAKDFDLTQVQRSLPLTGESAHPAQIQKMQAEGRIPIFVSEAMQDLYGWSMGQVLQLPALQAQSTALSAGDRKTNHTFQVAGIWRDYVRQSGSIVMQRSSYTQLTNDPWIDDILIWLAPDTEENRLHQANIHGPGASKSAAHSASTIAATAQKLRDTFPDEDLMIRSTQEIRTLSLTMFDRSFALTYVLEAVAVLGALFGVASTYSGEALARAREFGMLRHLGVTRAQISKIFAIETSIMLILSVVWGLLLSLGLAWILIHRINPQSFHWTMDTQIPWGVMLLSGLIVLMLGVLTAWFATRSATSEGPVLAVREDW